MASSAEALREDALTQASRQTHDWQLARIIDLGFHPEDAEELLRSVTSWHEVDRLMRFGATHAQVKRLLL
jgi:hypothetical protein